MTLEAVRHYEAEIRAFLLGRLGKKHTSGAIPRQRAERLEPAPVAAWWMFEGRRYAGLDGSLALALDEVCQKARLLLSTHNATWRLSPRAEGEVDWTASAMLAARGSAEVVTRASQVGLAVEERDALEGWLGWLRGKWEAYITAVDPPAGVPASIAWVRPAERTAGSFTDLRSWAHVARRSRWPLLRNVVADSLRCWIEPQELDAVPLPAEPERLFELLCLVRVLRALAPEPPALRWLGGAAGNRIELRGIKCDFQRFLSAADVLATSEFDHGLRAAVDAQGVRVPRVIDGLFLFDEPRAGLSGILLEAKSGQQTYDRALLQLKAYRAALRAAGIGRLLVWGVVEQDQGNDGLEASLARARDGTASEDLGVFSSADRIETVVSSLFAPKSRT